MKHFLHALSVMNNLSQAKLVYSDHTPNSFVFLEIVVTCYILFSHNYSNQTTYQSQKNLKWLC